MKKVIIASCAILILCGCEVRAIKEDRVSNINKTEEKNWIVLNYVILALSIYKC